MSRFLFKLVTGLLFPPLGVYWLIEWFFLGGRKTRLRNIMYDIRNIEAEEDRQIQKEQLKIEKRESKRRVKQAKKAAKRKAKQDRKEAKED